MEIKTRNKQASDLLDSLINGNLSYVRDEIRDCLANGSPTRILQVVQLMSTITRERGYLPCDEKDVLLKVERMVEAL